MLNTESESQLQKLLTQTLENKHVNTTNSVSHTINNSPLQKILQPILEKRQRETSNKLRLHKNLQDVKPITAILSQQKKCLDSMTNAKMLLSKYKSDNTSPDSWLISTARAIIAEPVHPMDDHGFLFEPTKTAAKPK